MKILLDNKIIIFLIFFLFSTFILVGIHASDVEDYKTDKIVDCNDVDGDLIEGMICYKVLKCSERIKILNDKGCEEFIGGNK